MKQSDNINVYINGRFLTQPITGVQRYAVELLSAIDNLLDQPRYGSRRYVFSLLAPPNVRVLPAYKNITTKIVGRFTGHAWEQIDLPFFSRDGMLVGFCNTGPMLRRRQMVTLCDASVYRVPQAFSRSFRWWYRILFATVGRRAQGLFTISKFSRDELASTCGLPPEKFVVTYPGVDHRCWNHSEVETNKRAFVSGRPFVLAVSSMSPHKNFHALVEAVSILGDTDFDVIIAGGTNPTVFKNADMSLPSSIKHVGYVSDDELAALYEQASCFIYPSLYEGFGLPPLESMSRGCPAIVASAGSLPEVCQDAVLYCDPRDPRDIAEKISRMMSDARLRADYRMRGVAHAKLYTWERCARETLSAIEKVLS